MEWNHPSIIVLKGFPFTGKTSLALELALQLRFCLLISLDDILDVFTPANNSSSSRPPRAEAEKLITKAFEVVCQQAEKQLSIGLSVIVDSLPLSRPHLDRLARLSKSSKVVILDCQIERTHAWQMRFKKEYSDNNNNSNSVAWYKARSWDEVTQTVKAYDKRLDEPVRGVSRLYLNVDKNVRGRHVIQAIQTLVFCQDDRHIDYSTWSNYNESILHNYQYIDKHHGDDSHDHTNCGHDHHRPAGKELLSRRRVSHTSRSCRDGHRISLFLEEGLVAYEADCLVCDNPVTGPAYACNTCQAALHKTCGELQASSYIYTPQQFPTFIKKNPTDDIDVYSFPENFPCFHCREAGKEFSNGCSGCIFKSLLKCRLVPTIIEHEGHAHKLSLSAMSIESGGLYTCAACGEKGAYATYSCYGDCEGSYHVDCALLPYPIRDHKHGGHCHTLELVFEREDKEFDDFPCSHCLENMRPEDWYYYCALCYQTYHLKCAFEDEDA